MPHTCCIMPPDATEERFTLQRYAITTLIRRRYAITPHTYLPRRLSAMTASAITPRRYVITLRSAGFLRHAADALPMAAFQAAVIIFASYACTLTELVTSYCFRP